MNRRHLAQCAALLAAVAAPASAETFAISGGTVALGDGSQPIPNGVVVVRDGRIVAAGDVRMKLPAGTQVIDASGKWVTPGIIDDHSHLGVYAAPGGDAFAVTYQAAQDAAPGPPPGA